MHHAELRLQLPWLDGLRVDSAAHRAEGAKLSEQLAAAELATAQSTEKAAALQEAAARELRTKLNKKLGLVRAHTKLTCPATQFLRHSF